MTRDEIREAVEYFLDVIVGDCLPCDFLGPIGAKCL
jgi:hypothetical protein